MSFHEKNKDKLISAYNDDLKSLKVIADEYGTYPNKIKRALEKLGVTLRDKSAAQSIALSEGRHSHPTRGKVRSEETKIKISESIYSYWQNISDEDYKNRVEKSKEQWDNLTKQQKENLRKAAGDGVRIAAKEGSKMEKFLQTSLKESGFDVIFHKTGLIPRNDLEVDLFIPSLKVAIEIDGPSHFFPIWGDANLRKHIKADAHKNGLLLSYGYIVIRVKHITKNLSNKHKRDVHNAIVEKLNEIKKKKPTKNNRFFEIEVK